MYTSDTPQGRGAASQYRSTRHDRWWLAAFVLGLVGFGGCVEGGRQMIYIGASFEGGYELTLLQSRVFGDVGDCTSVDADRGELWIVWSHIAMSEDFSDSFQIASGDLPEETHVAASDDGKRVYFSAGTYAVIFDRVGNTLQMLGEGMGAASFHSSQDLLVVEGPGSLTLVDLDAGGEEDLQVDGTAPSFLADASSVVYGRDGQVWTLDLDTGTESSLGEGLWPRATDDGSVVVFREGEDGPGIYEVAPGWADWNHLGAADASVLDSPWKRLAPDGRRVLTGDGEGGYTLRDWAGTAEDDWTMSSDLFCD